MQDNGRVIYSLSVEDIQTVALGELGRALTEDELGIVEEHLGDYIKWYDTISVVISNHINTQKELI